MTVRRPWLLRAGVFTELLVGSLMLGCLLPSADGLGATHAAVVVLEHKDVLLGVVENRLMQSTTGTTVGVVELQRLHPRPTSLGPLRVPLDRRVAGDVAVRVVMGVRLSRLPAQPASLRDPEACR